MTSQINGANVAMKNANDSISLMQTADGALSESSSILQRIRTLAVQSSNDTNTGVDRASLQSELSELVKEFDRIGKDTKFNGKELLSGSFSNNMFQIGANAGQTISFSIDSATAGDVGAIAKSTGTAVTANTATDITIKVGTSQQYAIGSSANYTHASDTTYRGADSAYAKVAAINASDANVVASAETRLASADLTAKLTQTATGAGTYALSINGTSIMSKALVATGTVKVTEVVDAINAKSSDTGVTASLDTATNKITVLAADGRNVNITETSGAAGVTALMVGAGDFAASGTANRGKITISANEAITIGGTVAEIGLAASINLDSKGIDEIDISTRSGAEEALLRIDAAIDTIDKSRANIGANQNRFNSVLNTLRNSNENISASRSRIQDADIASEMATMVKNQILAQASTAMIAQANQNSQMVLSLLR